MSIKECRQKQIKKREIEEGSVWATKYWKAQKKRENEWSDKLTNYKTCKTVHSGITAH